MRKKVLICTMMLLFLCNTAHAVMVNGQDWRQLTETVNLSYNDLAEIYDVSTGQLKDSSITNIGSVDFSGWIWASLEDVVALYSSFTGLTIGTYDFVEEAGSTWAPEYFKVFEATHTHSSYGVEQAGGTPRTANANSPTLTAPTVMQNWFDNEADDVAHTSGSLSMDYRSSSVGIHMYRAAPVPIPGAIWLLGTGLVGLVQIRRKKVNEK
jgi:hypothetical protein